jgi:GTP-binding protein
MSQPKAPLAKAVFIGGAPGARQVMAIKKQAALTHVPTVAIAGRSNVGKSTLLNALFGQSVARVSSTPGRTQAINLFRFRKIILADLPGYGYAKVSKDQRASWGSEIPKWFEADRAVQAVLLLADGRHGLTELDVQFLQYLQGRTMAHRVIFTKMDKFKSANQRRAGESQLAKQCLALGMDATDMIFVSGEKRQGLGVILSLLEDF